MNCLSIFSHEPPARGRYTARGVSTRASVVFNFFRDFNKISLKLNEGTKHSTNKLSLVSSQREDF